MQSPNSRMVRQTSHPRPVLSGQLTVMTLGSPSLFATSISTASSIPIPPIPIPIPDPSDLNPAFSTPAAPGPTTDSSNPPRFRCAAYLVSSRWIYCLPLSAFSRSSHFSPFFVFSPLASSPLFSAPVSAFCAHYLWNGWRWCPLHKSTGGIVGPTVSPATSCWWAYHCPPR